ncbi:hypothetical protein GCM10009555_014110 [Acrocarpospora macrocephala]|uniref:Uncharacterized protein n=1 Tax=Acrocarpospora macrocephala TaxID=150177 RepID=A0A5M3WJ63_9ACTN|nr:hypothetical protein Amac_018140 [Acrocarpospora macrocephala]
MLAAVTVVGVAWAAQAQAQVRVHPGAADMCARAAVVGLANKAANKVTATTGAVAGRNGRAAVGTALVAVGRTGVFTVLPCDVDPRAGYRLAALAGLPGLSAASGVLSVADAAGVAAGSGRVALPGLEGKPGLPDVPGLRDASSLVTLPELPGVPPLPGKPKSPAPNLVLAKTMPSELSGVAAGIPATSGLPEAPAVPAVPAVPDDELLPAASLLPKALPDAPGTVTKIAKSLLGDTLVP